MDDRGGASLPPLVHRLVGRPVTDDMDVNYARLCCRYVAASALLRGRVVPEDFRPAALRDPDILELARRVDVIVDSNPDPDGLFTTSESARRHTEHRAFIEAEPEQAERSGLTPVVITHQAPNPRCIRPWFQKSRLNAGSRRTSIR